MQAVGLLVRRFNSPEMRRYSASVASKSISAGGRNTFGALNFLFAGRLLAGDEFAHYETVLKRAFAFFGASFGDAGFDGARAKPLVTLRCAKHSPIDQRPGLGRHWNCSRVRPWVIDSAWLRLASISIITIAISGSSGISLQYKIPMRIALAQINPTVGDLSGNVNRMARAARDAAGRGAEAVVFPELSLTGYPPRDLVEKPSFLEASERELERLARETAGLDLSVICGYVARSQADTGKRALNSAAVLERGRDRFPAEQDAAAELRRVR